MPRVAQYPLKTPALHRMIQRKESSPDMVRTKRDQPYSPYQSGMSRLNHAISRLEEGALGSQQENPAQARGKNAGKDQGRNKVQRKCAECDTKAKDEESAKSEAPPGESKVQTKAAVSPSAPPGDAGADASSNLENRINNSKGRGRPMDERTQSEMGDAFGQDFRGVNVHTGGEAVQMNRELGSQAFTHGSDIYFNESKYQPESPGGKELLAHELTHVVQQGATGPQVQKADLEGFKIEGKWGGASRDKDSIYFDHDSKSVDSTEKTKIKAFAKHKAKTYELRPVSSEEGSDKSNKKLAKKRAKAVKKAFKDEKHTNIKINKTSWEKGANKMDYRRQRRVDIVDIGAPEDTSCKKTAANPHPEVTACGPEFTAAHPLAQNLVNGAISAVIGGLFNPLLNPWLRGSLNALFSDPDFGMKMLGHLWSLKSVVDNQKAVVECHNSCDQGCGTASAFMPPSAVGPSSKLTLCPNFFGSWKSPASRGQTLVHEALHVTSGLQTDDHAYGPERGFAYLAEDVAKENTDSYVKFILEMNSPGSVVPKLGAPRDKIDPSITGTEKKKLTRVMGYLEKWTIQTTADLESTYDTVVELREKRKLDPTKTWADVKYGYYEDTLSDIAPLFGLISPPAFPTEEEQIALAGIYDRMMKLDEMVWGTSLEIKKDNSGATRFTSGPTEPIFVTDRFLAMSQADMLDRLLAAAMLAHPQIPSSHKAKYVKIMKDVADHADLLKP